MVFLETTALPTDILDNSSKSVRDAIPDHLYNLTEVIGFVLGEGQRDARRIALEVHQSTIRAKQAWRSFHNHWQHSLDQVDFPAAREAARYLEKQGAGVVITSIHMGDLLSVLLHLGRTCKLSKPIIVIRDRHWSAEEELVINVFRRSDLEVQIARHHLCNVRSLVNQLRKGAIVVALLDLSRKWGQTTPVQFLGQAMNLVRGPAELAVLAGADILPIVCHFSRCDIPVANAGSVIRPRHRKNEPLAVRVQRITQQLAKIAGQQIMETPGQWQHWHLVPQMLHADGAR